MKYIKNFENIEELSDEELTKYEDKLSTIAIYLEDVLDMSEEDDGYIDCLWSDVFSESKGVIEFEFDFYADFDPDDDKIDNFMSKYDKKYKVDYKIYDENYNKTSHILYTIKIKVKDIDKLYNQAIIYNQAKKYNL